MESFCPTLKRKKAAILLVLDKHGVHSADLKIKILKEVFPSEDTVATWLHSHGISKESTPVIWNQTLRNYVLGQEEYTCNNGPYNFGKDRMWLKRACSALGLIYEDQNLNGVHKPFQFSVPRGWYFDPSRQVSKPDLCDSCAMNIKRDRLMRESDQQFCSRCWDLYLDELALF